MAERSHLSIGEVLSLLQDEFPDLTITKIRFLESQGLIDPERTPSGYRKFYEADIDRLRWILHQQRENFLPLKVIKDRLDESGEELPPLDEVVAAAPRPNQQLALGEVPDNAQRPAPVWMADHARVTAGAAPAAAPPHEATVAPVAAAAAAAAAPSGGAGPGGATGGSGGPGGQAAAPSSEPAAPGAGSGSGASSKPPTAPAPAPAPSSAPAPAAAAPSPPPAAPTGPPKAARPPATAPPKAPASGGEPRVDFPAAAVAGPREPVRASGPLPTVPVPVSPQGPPEVAPQAGARPSPLDAGPSGASLTFDELVAASGLTAAQVRDLEQYGMIEPGRAAGDPVYDEEAVVIARRSAAFFRHGAEPRHLRMYKVAADREAGFLEQVILPLLKQRNPAARQQAVTALSEMAQLGEALHASFLRQALRDHLKG